MIESNTINSQQSIRDSRFKIAGWLSICTGILILPIFIIAIISQFNPILKPVLLYVVYIPLVFILNIFTVYVYIQFKRLLKERYDFYNADTIITIQIIIMIIIGAKDILVANIKVLFPLSAFVGMLDTGLGILSLLLVGIIGIILGVTLLAIREDPYGLLRTYAIIVIVTSSCLASIILSPLGILLILLNNVILGIIFFKAAETEAQVEFV